MPELTDDQFCALAFSILFFVLVYFGGQKLKKCCLFIVERPIILSPEQDESHLRYIRESVHTALQDGVASFQACACSLENGIIRVTLGNMAVLASIAIHGILMVKYAWRDAYGSTCNVFYRYLNNQTDLLGVCLSWLCQLLGAFLALYTSYFWWGLRLSTSHAALHSQRTFLLRQLYEEGFQESDGVGDLNVPILGGIFVEAGVAFADVVMAGGMPAFLALWRRRHSLRREDCWAMEFTAFTLRQALGIYLVHLGLPLTGAYVNGVNAIIQTWGLGRAASPVSHILVYWISPLIGVWMGLRALKSLQSFSFMWTHHPAAPEALVDLHEDVVDASPSTTYSEESANASELVNSWKITREGLQLAAVCGSPRTFRSKSLSRQRPGRVMWRRSSECRFLPNSSQGSHLHMLSASFSFSSEHLNSTGELGDYWQFCRRCPIRNEEDGEGDFIGGAGLRQRQGRLRNRRSYASD